MNMGVRWLIRDWRGGDITILVVALALAVAIVTGVSLFSERLGNAIVARSSAMLGADLVIQGPRPLDDALLVPARELGLRASHSLSFATMAARGMKFQISSVMAIDGTFPLLGDVLLEGESQPVVGPSLEPGQVWADRRLLAALDLSPQQSVEVGDAELRLGAVLVDAPGGGLGASFSVGPRVLMHIDDLPASGVIQPGSRVRHRYYFAGPPAAIKAYRQRIAGRLLPEHQVFTVTEGRPGLAGAIAKAQSYLLLGGALGVALAGAAIAIAARRYTERHIQSVAVLKTLGASGGAISSMYMQKFLALVVVATLLGFGLGWLIQALIGMVVQRLTGYELAAAGWSSYGLGGATALLCLFAFAFPPLLALRSVPPLAALRRDVSVQRIGPWVSWLLGLLGVFLLVLWYSRSWWLTVALFAGLLCAVLAVAVLGALLIRSTHLLAANAGNQWLLASSSLRRRGAENALQIVVFAITIMLLLVLMVTRSSLVSEWQDEIPEGTPNHFIVNLLPESVPQLTDWLAARSLEHAGIYPLVSGRLTHVNKVPLAEVLRSDDAAAPNLDRELRLTSSADLPIDNTLLQGQWWEAAKDPAQVSVEAQLARSLGIEPGDDLRFQVGSELFEVTVASIRSVNWENMRPNFYMIFPVQALEKFPSTSMTSFYLPPDRKQLLGELVRAFPAVTVIETDAIIRQVREVIEQVTLAIEAILWLVMSCGALVLWATVEAGLAERFRESSILRTLGAPSRLVLGAIVIEFLLLGVIAGLLAALGAEATTWVLQEKLFQVDWRPHVWLWLTGPLVGGLLIATIGTLASRSVVATPPVEVLRSLH